MQDKLQEPVSIQFHLSRSLELITIKDTKASRLDRSHWKAKPSLVMHLLTILMTILSTVIHLPDVDPSRILNPFFSLLNALRTMRQSLQIDHYSRPRLLFTSRVRKFELSKRGVWGKVRPSNKTRSWYHKNSTHPVPAFSPCHPSNLARGSIYCLLAYWSRRSKGSPLTSVFGIEWDPGRRTDPGIDPGRHVLRENKIA